MRLGTGELLLVFAVIVEHVLAHQGTHYTTSTCWETKTTTTATPVAVSAWSVYKVSPSTETVWKEKTVYNTVYSTVTATELITSSIVTTKYESIPNTIISTKTEPVTIYVASQNIVTEVSTVTHQSTLIQVHTAFNHNTVTLVNTEVQTNTVLSIQYSTVTITDSRPTTVTAACNPTTTSTSRSLTGLVTCPSRIVNPTYTPARPLPSNYVWGCAPGYICQPTQENCNFEQNPPADTYICPPEQCKKAAPLPSLQEIRDLVNRGNSCAWLTPTPGYFNLNPIPWGLSFAIFNVSGQSTCPAVPKTPWSTWSALSQRSSTHVPQPTWTAWSEIHTRLSSTAVAHTQWNQWSGKSSSTAPTTAPTQTRWVHWKNVLRSPSPDPVSHTTSYASQITPRAVLVKRAKEYPAVCFEFCNYAQEVFQSIGKDTEQLCQNDGAFARAVQEAASCSDASPGVGGMVLNTDLDDAVGFCGQTVIARALIPRSSGIVHASIAPSEITPVVRYRAATETILSPPSPVVSPSSGEATATASPSVTTSFAIAMSTPTTNSGISTTNVGKMSAWMGMLLSLLSFALLL